MQDYPGYIVYQTSADAAELYRGVLDRLIADVEEPMRYYRKTAHGNWSSIRMIAPVIEAIAKNDVAARNKILNEIGIEYSTIFWTMYRHGLLHNDSAPQSIQLGEQSLGWGFNWGQKEAAIIVGTVYSLNPYIIFENLLGWIREQLSNPESLSGIEVSTAVLVEIKPDKDSLLKEEFNQIMKSRNA